MKIIIEQLFYGVRLKKYIWRIMHDHGEPHKETMVLAIMQIYLVASRTTKLTGLTTEKMGQCVKQKLERTQSKSTG